MIQTSLVAISCDVCVISHDNWKRSFGTMHEGNPESPFSYLRCTYVSGSNSCPFSPASYNWVITSSLSFWPKYCKWPAWLSLSIFLALTSFCHSVLHGDLSKLISVNLPYHHCKSSWIAMLIPWVSPFKFVAAFNIQYILVIEVHSSTGSGHRRFEQSCVDTNRLQHRK